MRKTASVFFILMLVLAGCFIAGCSSLPFSGASTPTPTPGSVNKGFSVREKTGTSQRLAFNDTIARVFLTDIFDEQSNSGAGVNGSLNSSEEKHIQYVRGNDLDENGNAASWTYIVEHGGRYSLVTFNNRGVSISEMPGMVRRAEIPAGQIVTPGELFLRNKALVSGTHGTGAGVTRDLNLAEGEYTLTLTTGRDKPEVLIFDAVTGALKP